MSLDLLLPVWSITMLDETGTSGIVRGTLKPGHDAGAYLAAIENLAALIGGVSGCVSVRCAVTYRVKESDAISPRRTDAIGTLAQYTFTASETETFSVVETPASLSQTITTGCFAGQEIDETIPAVADFIAAVEDGLFCDPFGIDIDGFCSAHIATG